MPIEVEPFKITYTVTHTHTGESSTHDNLYDAFYAGASLMKGYHYRWGGVTQYYADTPVKHWGGWLTKPYRYDYNPETRRYDIRVPQKVEVQAGAKFLHIKDNTGRFYKVSEIQDELKKPRPYKSYWDKQSHKDWERRKQLHGSRTVRKKGSGDKIKRVWASEPYTDVNGDADFNQLSGYHRRLMTTQERRYAIAHADEYGPEFIRGKRNAHGLPNAWDDYSNGIWDRRKSWKHHSKRRKQWKPL